MVVHASNFEGLDFKSARDSSHVGPKPSLNIQRDDLAPLLGGEDAMIERGTIGVRHTPPSYSRFSPRAREIPSLRPDGADGFNAHAFPGFHPGLFSYPPCGRSQRRFGHRFLHQGCAGVSQDLTLLRRRKSLFLPIFRSDYFQGLMTPTPVGSKCLTLRVATAKPRAEAQAAI